MKALGTGIGFDISRLNFDLKMDFLQENTVTVDTSMKVDGVHYPEWVFEEHSLNNHCIVVAQNQKVFDHLQCQKILACKLYKYKILFLDFFFKMY